MVLSPENIVRNSVLWSNHFHKDIPSFNTFRTRFDDLFHNFPRKKMFQLLQISPEKENVDFYSDFSFKFSKDTKSPTKKPR